MAGGFGLDDFFIPTDGTLRIYNKTGTNYNQLGVSPDAIGKISVDGVTLTTNSEGAIEINLGNANTWTALQTFSSGVSASLVENTATQTTITGTTAGSAIASMPEQGSSYKKAIVWLDAYENDSTTAQTYTFPVAFTNTPAITTNSASVPGVTVSTTALSLAPDTTTAYTGWIIIEGY